MPSCCVDPCENPNSLEYKKCFKPEHNSGCCGECPKQNEEESSTLTVVTNKLSRQDFV